MFCLCLGRCLQSGLGFVVFDSSQSCRVALSAVNFSVKLFIFGKRSSMHYCGVQRKLIIELKHDNTRQSFWVPGDTFLFRTKHALISFSKLL